MMTLFDKRFAYQPRQIFEAEAGMSWIVERLLALGPKRCVLTGSRVIWGKYDNNYDIIFNGQPHHSIVNSIRYIYGHRFPTIWDRNRDWPELSSTYSSDDNIDEIWSNQCPNYDDDDFLPSERINLQICLTPQKYLEKKAVNDWLIEHPQEFIALLQKGITSRQIWNTLLKDGALIKDAWRGLQDL